MPSIGTCQCAKTEQERRRVIFEHYSIYLLSNCGYLFSSTSLNQSVNAKNLMVTPVRCPHCGKEFVKSYFLNAHLRKFHPNRSQHSIPPGEVKLPKAKRIESMTFVESIRNKSQDWKLKEKPSEEESVTKGTLDISPEEEGMQNVRRRGFPSTERSEYSYF